MLLFIDRAATCVRMLQNLAAGAHRTARVESVEHGQVQRP